MLKHSAMERRENTAPQEDDVTSAAGEALQFDDDTLRGKTKNIQFASYS